MSKQPLPTECFETAFLEYLRMRFEFEPLIHYVMAAIHVCNETGHDYPDFVTGFMTWFADNFLFSTQGRYPTQSRNEDPADAQWRRYQDCHELLEGWLNDDLGPALDRQEARLVLIEDVEIKRAEERTDESVSGQKRSSLKKPETVVFAEIAEEKGVSADSVRRAFKRQTEPAMYFSHLNPIALTRCDGGYTVENRAVVRPGEIHFSEGKKLRL